jgi:tetratricopeptide (TPR) repeat protein
MMQTATAQAAPAPVHWAALKDLARSLQQEGRNDDALTLFRHLSRVRADAETLRPLARLLSAQGRTLEAIETLCALKAVDGDRQTLLSDIQSQMQPALDGFNRHIAAGEIKEAEKVASALVTLVPRNTAFLNAALDCNLVLGDKDKARKYAAMLLPLDEANEKARTLLSEAAKYAPAPSNDIEQRLADVLSPTNATHSLLRLRDLHDVASAILCQPLQTRGIQQIGRILAAGQSLAVQVPPASEYEGWEKHYRLMLDAIDMTTLLGPTPEPGIATDAGLLSSTGTSVSWADLRKAADKLGAKTIFFAAADRHYVDLYARWYIKSILKYCDVPFMIVVHVIGGDGELSDIAKSVGVADKRLFFASDAFDAGAVTTKCFDTPPKSMIAKPVAHFQSVRFQRLGMLLQQLNRPVFVSDIDLLLQRGVSDLLDAHADSDVVFNENDISTNAGSRLTANLLLVNPTENADVLLRFLSVYLERMLSRREVTRWIDQFGLLMARQHLSLKVQHPRIGYFDTSRDINNVMFPSYQDNPFRFLSLYHGFDLSSLEDQPKVLGKTVIAKRPRAKNRAARTKRISKR